MSMQFEDRLSDSPYVAHVTRGQTLSDGSVIRPAEINWHLVLSRRQDKTQVLLVGPWSKSGEVIYDAGAEILWIRFKVGVYMPHLITRKLLNQEITLPDASNQSFWLKSTHWQLPDYDNADTFVDRLIRDELLVQDPVVHAALQDRQLYVSPRTVHHRFLQTTGLSQSHIFQVQRAREAQALLFNGTSILDTVEAAGYYDQPHLTRSLKQFIGLTPAQISELNQPD